MNNAASTCSSSAMVNTAASSFMDLVPKKEKYLIAFNKFKKITFFGTCKKIRINKIDQSFTFNTNAINEKFKEFVSTFNRIFVQKENALCIIDAISNKNFIVIFPLKSKCDRIVEEINKVKFPSGPPTCDSATDDLLFKNNFYIPILKEIQSKITGYMEIKTVLLELINKFDPDQRRTYMNIIFELSVFDMHSSINASTISGTVTNEGNQNVDDTNNDDEMFDGTVTLPTDQSLYETAASSSYRKRHVIIFPTYDFATSSFTDHESNLGSSASKKSRRSSAADDDQMNQTFNNSDSSDTETLTASYEFVECFRHGAIRNQILIFTSDVKDECYEFYYSTSSSGWRSCKNCSKKNQRTVIKIISVENGKMEFMQGKNQHICQPIKYLPAAYTVKELSLDDLLIEAPPTPKAKPKLRRIQKSNYKIEMVPNKRQREKSTKVLIINDPAFDNQEFSYYYNQKYQHFYCKKCHVEGKYVSAKCVQDENGEECLELSGAKHVCL